MALTNAERQKAYRQRRGYAGENGERRINTWVSTGASLALKRLSNSYGVTERAMLEKLIREADDQCSAGLKLDTPEWDAYYRIGDLNY